MINGVQLLVCLELADMLLSSKRGFLKYSNLKALTILPFFYSSIIFLLLVQHGDIEINPGPKKKQLKYFLCCPWNVNSLLELMTKYHC